MFEIVVFILIHFTFSTSSLIDFSSTKMMTINDTSAYFGYSILLQKGNPPIAVVGAPRKKHGRENTGSVYKCNLNNLQCTEYSYVSRIRGVYPYNKNGDFMGSSVDGGDTAGNKFFTCSPRYITLNDNDHYTYGRCFEFTNSNDVNHYANAFSPLKNYNPVERHISIPYYDAAFGEAGFSIVYSQDQNELIIGAVGKSMWNGDLVRVKGSAYDLFSFQPNFTHYHDNYYGYAVARGKFIKGSQKVWYIAGGPRGCGLRGHVIFFDQNARVLSHMLCGEEYGSYFGASLLVIHKSGGGDDLLVGSPMFAGDSADEGCVYFYRNKNDGTFYKPVKLSRKERSSRFGTVMADVGDIDLDTFSDCVIAAPYENDGTGAIYLYYGTKEGFSNDKFLRITPTDFAMVYPKITAKGFGLGVSKGNDVNNDRHSDLIVGAYLSGQIFYFTTTQMFDVTKSIIPNRETLLTSTKNFIITYCAKFTFRNGDTSTQRSFFTVLILDDNRIVSEQNVSEIITLKPDEVLCKNHTVDLKDNHLNIEPIVIRFGHKLYNSNDSLSEDTLSIPVSYECGTDNVCQTNLRIKGTKVDTTKITIGVSNELRVNVTIDNIGESAYQTKLYLNLPQDVSLINLRECDLENGSYVCLISQMLRGTTEKSFLLDLVNLQPNYTNLLINFSVTSIGNDTDPSDNNFQLNVPVILQNNPYIDSRSIPSNIFLNRSEEFLQITHYFLVSNQGPSPINLDLVILVPEIKANGSNILEINGTEGFINGVASTCRYSGFELPTTLIQADEPNDNNMKIIRCTKWTKNCIAIYCNGGYFPKSNENAIFTLKLLLHVQAFAKTAENVNRIIIASTAYFKNETNQFFATASTLIYGTSTNQTLPLWIYLVSIISGVVLLIILIYSLYKCNFFKRTYRERLDNEQSVDESLVQEENQQEEE